MNLAHDTTEPSNLRKDLTVSALTIVIPLIVSGAVYDSNDLASRISKTAELSAKEPAWDAAYIGTAYPAASNEDSSQELLSALLRVATDLTDGMADLDPEYAKILEDNLFDLL